MSKIHIISNRLPVSIQKSKGQFNLIPSIGGLATGMRSIYKEYGGRWIGWSGITCDEINDQDTKKIDKLLESESCLAVDLTKEEINRYYEGFSNNVIWPLFHYFLQYIECNTECWETYKSVNRKFADKALETLEDGDFIWIHDYHLLLVPEMIKTKLPGVTIGFFLHIPFPSFEVFRILPWRIELLKGMLGADLLGFHTYDYKRYFFNSVRRLLGYETSFNEINVGDRIVMGDAFPMGIDFEKFSQNAKEVFQKPRTNKSELHLELENYFLASPQRKLILSIDRLDYTKGIPNRLRAFELFLEQYPEFQKRVTLIMLVVPSRIQVEKYMLLKSEIDELVGKINGRFGGVNYNPVWYFFRSLPFNNLVELYSKCDVALITPVRDGMNLVAKEYVACRFNQTGVIILSEMAGASKEMGEAIIINPLNEHEIADAIFQAFKMPLEEQQERMRILQERISRYNVFKWAKEFVSTLKKIETVQQNFLSKLITPSIKNEIIGQFKKAKKRAVFLDLEGTLINFGKDTKTAFPDEKLNELLTMLENDKRNTVTILTRRDKEAMENRLGNHNVNMIVEHGVWLKKHGEKWQMLDNINNNWKALIRPILDIYVDRTPGAFITEMNFSLIWNYQKSELEQGEMYANELKDDLMHMIANNNLQIMEGNKVIEIKTAGINKGIAAKRFLKGQKYDFILGIGDDWSDDYLYRELPENAVTINVGMKNTAAQYKIKSIQSVRHFLKYLAE